jgi:hypothetical protein
LACGTVYEDEDVEIEGEKTEDKVIIYFLMAMSYYNICNLFYANCLGWLCG